MREPRVRIFIAQTKMDAMLEAEDAELQGDKLHLPQGSPWLSGVKLKVETAVLVTKEITGLGDHSALVGRIKSVGQIEEMGGEYCEGTVILGDAAYEAVEGFLGTPSGVAVRAEQGEQGEQARDELSGDELSSGTAPQAIAKLSGSSESASPAGEHSDADEIDALAELFLER